MGGYPQDHDKGNYQMRWKSGDTGGTAARTGSGVIMRSQKAAGLFIVTNRHVVDGADLGAHEAGCTA